MFWAFGPESTGRSILFEKSEKGELESALLTLARLHAGVLFIDDINTALTANNAVVPVSFLQRFQRIAA